MGDIFARELDLLALGNAEHLPHRSEQLARSIDLDDGKPGLAVCKYHMFHCPGQRFRFAHILCGSRRLLFFLLNRIIV